MFQSLANAFGTVTIMLSYRYRYFKLAKFPISGESSLSLLFEMSSLSILVTVNKLFGSDSSKLKLSVKVFKFGGHLLALGKLDIKLLSSCSFHRFGSCKSSKGISSILFFQRLMDLRFTFLSSSDGILLISFIDKLRSKVANGLLLSRFWREILDCTVEGLSF